MAGKIRKGLAYRRVGEELFVVDGAGGRLHELNGSAAVIWEALARGRELDAIAADLAGQFEIDAVTARRDAEEFQRQLLAAGLLEGK